MRYLTLSSLLWLCCAACADDDANATTRPRSGETSPDAGTTSPSKSDAGNGDKTKDAAAADSSASRLPRPGLPRAPGKGLPADLRPPR